MAAGHHAAMGDGADLEVRYSAPKSSKIQSLGCALAPTPCSVALVLSLLRSILVTTVVFNPAADPRYLASRRVL